MQRFRAPLTAEDQKLARRIGRIVFVIYSVAALALTAGVVAHIAFIDPKIASQISDNSEQR
jgi:hypothetical protein